MANITLQIGTEPLSADPRSAKDLSKAAQDLRFIFDGPLKSLLNQPLSSVPHGTHGALTLDAGNPSWTLAGAPATFSLKAKSTAAVTVHSPEKAPLFAYYQDFGHTKPASCPGKSGSIYVITEFQFNVTGNLSAEASAGNIGITTNDSGSAGYTVRNYKAFPQDTILRDALLGALAAFTLPLHLHTLNNLEDGDCLYYEFDGALNVCFGVTYGIDAAVGGYSLSEISSVFEKLSQIFNVSSPQVFTASATVGPSVKFNWSRRFQCFLERNQPIPAQPGWARLHISTGANSQRSLRLSADAGISLISPPELSVNGDTLVQWILQKAYGKTNPQLSQSIQTLSDQLRKEVPRFVSDTNKWLSGLFQRLDGAAEISLALRFQNTTGFTTAFTWEFDLHQPAFSEAWQAAIGGDFLAALRTGAVILDPNSGFEHLHYNSTKLSLTLFGLTYFQSIDTYFARSTVRYAGNGQFYLETSTGKVASSLDLNNKTNTAVYLEGTAQGAGSGSGAMNASNIQIRLHGILSSTNNRKQTARLGALLRCLGALPQQDGVGPNLTAAGAVFGGFASPPGPTSLHFIYQASALKRLPSDEDNWNAYAWASDTLPSDPADFLSIWVKGDSNNAFYRSYASWAAFNRLTNGFTGLDGNPDTNMSANRQMFGNYQAALLRNYFGETLRDIDANQLNIYFCAGQQYMNLCGDLSATLRQHETQSRADWGELTAKLATIAGTDIDAWFGAAVMLALAKSCQPVTVTVLEEKFGPSDRSGAVTLSIS